MAEFNSMLTENDVNNVSSISCATNASLFGGSSEPHLAEISAARYAILGDREQLVHRYKDIMKLDQDQQDNVSDDFTRDSHYLYYEKNQGGGKPKGIRPYFNLYSAPDRYKNGARWGQFFEN